MILFFSSRNRHFIIQSIAVGVGDLVNILLSLFKSRAPFSGTDWAKPRYRRVYRYMVSPNTIHVNTLIHRIRC